MTAPGWSRQVAPAVQPMLWKAGTPAYPMPQHCYHPVPQGGVTYIVQSSVHPNTSPVAKRRCAHRPFVAPCLVMTPKHSSFMHALLPVMHAQPTTALPKRPWCHLVGVLHCTAAERMPAPIDPISRDQPLPPLRAVPDKHQSHSLPRCIVQGPVAAAATNSCCLRACPRLDH